MAEAIAKIKNNKGIVNCNTGDTDGLLVNTLLEALTGTNRLNVGAYGRSTRTPTNYSTAGQSIDQHLAGIDTALGAAPVAHLMGSASHTADSLGNLNSKVTGGSLDFTTATRVPTIHNLGSNLRHGVDTLANLNALISDANLDDDGDSRPPSGSASGDLASNYPGPTVAKLQGYSIQTGAPTTDDKFVYQNSQWEHVSTSKVRAYLSSATQSIPNNTKTLVEFDAETYDTLGDFNTGTYRFVAPVTGYYLVNGSVYCSFTAGAQWSAYIHRSGTEIHRTHLTGFTAVSMLNFHDLVYMTASQYLEIWVHQNSGVAKNILGTEKQTHLQVVRLL